MHGPDVKLKRAVNPWGKGKPTRNSNYMNNSSVDIAQNSNFSEMSKLTFIKEVCFGMSRYSYVKSVDSRIFRSTFFHWAWIVYFTVFYCSLSYCFAFPGETALPISAAEENSRNPKVDIVFIQVSLSRTKCLSYIHEADYDSFCGSFQLRAIFFSLS